MQSSLWRFLKGSVLVIGILYTVLYLLCLLAAHFDPNNGYLFTFLPLVFPYIFAGMIVWCVIAVLLFKKKGAYFIIPLLLGSYDISHVIGLHTINTKMPEKKQATLRVLSWNVQDFIDSQKYTDTIGNKRRDIFTFIKEANADVVCLEDVTERTGPGFLSNVDTLHKLGYPYLFFSKDFGFEDPAGIFQYGTIICSKYPIVDSGRIEYPQERFAESLAFADILYQNETVRFYNTHLQSMMLNFEFTLSDAKVNDMIKPVDISVLQTKSKSKKIRHYDLKHAEQAKMVKAALQQCTYPFIFCADLNSVPASYTYNTIQAGLTDAFVAKGGGFGQTYDGLAPNLRIDVQLMSPQWKVLNFYNPTLHITDHFPIVTDVALSK